MNTPEEWQDMKTQWQGNSIGEKWMTEKLRWSLRLRMVGSWLWLGLEVSAFVLLLVLAGVQVAMGEYAVAVALTLLNLAFAAFSLWARRSPLRGASGSLLELVDLTIQRARRSVRFAWAQYLTTAVCVAYVLVMYFADIGDSLAAYNDAGRVTGALAIFSLYAVGVGFYHYFARRRLHRFSELRQEIVSPVETG